MKFRETYQETICNNDNKIRCHEVRDDEPLWITEDRIKDGLDSLSIGDEFPLQSIPLECQLNQTQYIEDRDRGNDTPPLGRFPGNWTQIERQYIYDTCDLILTHGMHRAFQSKRLYMHLC